MRTHIILTQTVRGQYPKLNISYLQIITRPCSVIDLLKNGVALIISPINGTQIIIIMVNTFLIIAIHVHEASARKKM